MGLDNGIRVMHKEGKILHIPKKYYDYVVDDFEWISNSECIAEVICNNFCVDATQHQKSEQMY